MSFYIITEIQQFGFGQDIYGQSKKEGKDQESIQSRTTESRKKAHVSVEIPAISLESRKDLREYLLITG